MNRRMFFGTVGALLIGRGLAPAMVASTAGGIIVRRPDVVLIGEHGQECVVPLQEMSRRFALTGAAFETAVRSGQIRVEADA